jgi:trimethylamine:corrinoid methyltransferase-like protein
MKMRKLFSLLLILCMLLSAVPALAEEAKGDLWIGDYELSYWVPLSFIQAQHYTDLNEHPFFQWMEEQTGVHINFIHPSEEQMQQIHEASLEILQNTGIVYQSEAARDVLKAHGATVEGEKVFIPASLVSECLSKVPSSFRVDAINPDRAVTVGGDLVIHPAGGEVFLKDANGHRYNTTTIKQFSDLQKIYQACDNINMTGYQPLSPGDVPVETRGLHCLYETML